LITYIFICFSEYCLSESRQYQDQISDQESLDDSVNDPDFMPESESEDERVSDTTDTSEIIPLVQALPALSRKRKIFDLLEDGQTKRNKKEERQENYQVTATTENFETRSSGVTVQKSNNENGLKCSTAFFVRRVVLTLENIISSHTKLNLKLRKFYVCH